MAKCNQIRLFALSAKLVALLYISKVYHLKFELK